MKFLSQDIAFAHKAIASGKATKPHSGAFAVDPQIIRARRKEAGLTQTKAAQLVHAKLRTWQDWEAGNASMHAGLWELFNIKTS